MASPPLSRPPFTLPLLLAQAAPQQPPAALDAPPTSRLSSLLWVWCQSSLATTSRLLLITPSQHPRPSAPPPPQQRMWPPRWRRSKRLSAPPRLVPRPCPAPPSLGFTAGLEPVPTGAGSSACSTRVPRTALSTLPSPHSLALPASLTREAGRPWCDRRTARRGRRWGRWRRRWRSATWRSPHSSSTLTGGRDPRLRLAAGPRPDLPLR